LESLYPGTKVSNAEISREANDPLHDPLNDPKKSRQPLKIGVDVSISIFGKFDYFFQLKYWQFS
jgi:hypothetical protein